VCERDGSRERQRESEEKVKRERDSVGEGDWMKEGERSRESRGLR
jgi:hypothetical protein